MILREMSMQIKFMSEDGRTKAEIARQLGISRQTVYNHLKRTEPFPKPRAKRASKLDAHKSYIRTRLEVRSSGHRALRRAEGARLPGLSYDPA